MGSSRLVGTGKQARYVARWRDPQGKQHSKSFKRSSDAKDWLAQVSATMQSGTYMDPGAGKVRFKVWADKWEATLGHLKPSTRATYLALQRKHVRPKWDNWPLATIRHEEVSAWVSELTTSDLAPATVRYVHRVFSLQLEFAVRSYRLPRNPAEGVRLPRAGKPEKRFLTHEQVHDLAEACDDYAAVVLTLGYCGLRWSELAGLKVGRVDPLRRRLSVTEAVTEVRGELVWGTPKDHQQRSVPFPRLLVDPLAEWMAGKSPEDLLFTARKGGVLRNRNFRRDVFDLAAIEAGLAGVTPHELRHTAASLAVSAGANVKAVQRMLGHASAAMTLDVYSGLFDDDLDAVAERLDSGANARKMRDPQEVITLHTGGAGR